MDKEKMDRDADLHRKYTDVYSSKYTTPEAYRYRVRKIIEEKIKPHGKHKGKVTDKIDSKEDILFKMLKQGGKNER
jgi:hypothetical protein